ncbi:hypothetical protein FDF12_04005 [Clostridium botulinum]|nr:hypothetical protein [Clostridium botulinum]NFS52675.1 hypothetical protein [Clostridium botulinum]NFT16590.1 hypothetical protein [Clostridium botulinum]
MANKIDKNDGDMTREDLEKWALENEVLGFSHSKFNDNFIAFCDDYKINPALFYKSPKYEDERKNVDYRCIGGSGFLIKKEWKDIILILLQTYRKNPFIAPPYDLKTGKINFRSVDEYYDEVIKMIDDIPNNEEKYSLEYNSVYFRTKLEKHIIKMVKDKMAQLSAATSCIGFKSKIELWIKLYEYLDQLIYYAYDRESEIKNKHNERVEETKDEWRKTLDAEYKLTVLNASENGEVNDKIHKAALDQMMNSPTLVMSDMLINVLEKDYEYSQEKSLSEFLVEKLKEGMALYPVNPIHIVNDPNNNKEYAETKQEKEESMAQAVSENIEDIKKVIDKTIKGKNIIVNGYGEKIVLKNVDGIESILLEVKKILLENSEKELNERIANLNNIETTEKWAIDTLISGKDNGYNITDEDREYILNYMNFLKKVKCEENNLEIKHLN